MSLDRAEKAPASCSVISCARRAGAFSRYSRIGAHRLLERASVATRRLIQRAQTVECLRLSQYVVLVLTVALCCCAHTAHRRLGRCRDDSCEVGLRKGVAQESSTMRSRKLDDLLSRILLGLFHRDE
jgi:hypothetical protein